MCESPLISFRCALTLFWHSERPNVGETTVICDLGTSTVRFSVHAKMLTMSNDDLERTLKNVQVEFENLVKRTHLPKPNLTGREYKAVKELRNHPELTIVKSDKGGELVVMNTTQLHDLTTDHLSDETTYKKLPKNPTEAMRMEINQTLKNILIARGYPRNFYEKFMTPETAKTQRFYTLPKTHKKTLT